MKTGSSLIIAAVFTSTQLHAVDWPNWRGPAHDGVSSETGWQSDWPAAGPKRLWKADVGTGFASVTVSEGRVFTLGNKDDTDTVFCFDAATGDTVWSFAYKQPLAPKYYEGGPSATPTVDGNRVFTFSKSGLVHCLDAANGKLIWKKDLAGELGLKEPTWGFAGSPLVHGEWVLFNAGDSGVALDKQSGAIVWNSGKGPGGYSTPVPFRSGEQPCVALMGKNELMGVQVKDGEVLWRYPWKTKYDVNAADPILIEGGRYFISSGYNHGCALVKVVDGTPTLLWKNKNMRNKMSGGVLLEGHVYGCDEKELACVDIQTGERKWADSASGEGSVTAADGKLIILSDKGELIIAEASPEGFKPLSRAQVLGGKCWSVPVLANGRIYARNAKGDVVCLDVSGK